MEDGSIAHEIHGPHDRMVRFKQWKDLTIRNNMNQKTGCGEYKFSIRTNIRIYLYLKNDTNEYPNIFVSKK